MQTAPAAVFISIFFSSAADVRVSTRERAMAEDRPKIKEKVKSFLHIGRKSGSGSTASPRTSQTGASEVGPDAYRPLTDSVKGDRGLAGHGTGGTGSSAASSAATGQASNTGTGSAISGSNAAGATNPALTEANSSASGRGAGAPIAGDSVMREITQKTNADGSTDVATDFAHEPWEIAREKTLAAEREAATAHIAGQKAGEHLRAAGAAQGIVQREADQHAQALAEADRVRPAITSPTFLEKDVAHTQELVGAKRLAAEDAAREVKVAEAELAEKARLAEERKPVIDEHHRKVTTLTEDYDKHIKEVEGRESNKGELLAAAANAQNLLDRHGAEIDALTFELNKADEIAAEREKEFITAKDAASALRARLANAREHGRELEGGYLAKQKQADEAEDSIEGYREESTRIKRQLDEYEEEWTRMQNTERDYQADADEANRALEGLRGRYDPAALELKDADRKSVV